MKYLLLKYCATLTVYLLGFCLLTPSGATAQHEQIVRATADQRIQVLWNYCLTHFISDEEPARTNAFFSGISRLADSLGDRKLQAYTRYFQYCSRILFSVNYQKHFKPGDYQTVVNTFMAAGKAGQKEGFEDILASAEHYIGQVYYLEGLYGQSFEYLLKADNRMQHLGYGNVPAVSVYLHELGLNYYQFTDYDKALTCFREAIRYPQYVPRYHLNSLNGIGLIYLKRGAADSAIAYFQRTLDVARTMNDEVWVGIASGNLGSVYLRKADAKTALDYFKVNYRINSSRDSGALPDAALTATYMAKAFARNGQPDSANFYLKQGLGLVSPQRMIRNDWLNLYKNYLESAITVYRQKGSYGEALEMADSLLVMNDSIYKTLDNRILNRAVQKTEAERNQAQLQLLESETNIGRLRLLLIIGGLVAVLIIVLLLFKSYRWQKREQDKLSAKEKQLLSVEKLRAEESLHHARLQLNNYVNTIREKNDYIENLAAEMLSLKEHHFAAAEAPPTLQTLLSKTILTDADWLHFRGLFEQVYPGFTERLFTRYPQLTPAESRLLVLSRLDLSPRDIANMLGVSVDAIRKLRYRLRKKLDWPEDVDWGIVLKEI
jgi:tetratricopeptide (TPR) repeat protein